MAHFAKLNKKNIVTEVIVVDNNVLLEDGVELESKGIEFCQSLFGGTWVQTSYNGNKRYNYAAIGFIYDATRDAFIAPEPANAISFDETTCTWIVPKVKHEIPTE